MAIVANPYNTGTIMYNQYVMEAFLIDQDGGIDAMTSLAISIAKGDQAGTVINIGYLAAPQILEMLKPIKNIEIDK